jgi:hypothetical protein
MSTIEGGRTRVCSCQASAEHFQQCAEVPPLRNRGLGPLAVPELPIPLPGRPARTHPKGGKAIAGRAAAR